MKILVTQQFSPNFHSQDLPGLKPVLEVEFAKGKFSRERTNLYCWAAIVVGLGDEYMFKKCIYCNLFVYQEQQ